MTTSTLNALLLLSIALVVAWCVWSKSFLQSQKEMEQEMPSSLENMDIQALRTLTEKRYKRKKLYRIGVLLCSCLAAALYLDGQSRITAIVFLIGAGLCQYGAVQQKTSALVSQVMQHRGIQS